MPQNLRFRPRQHRLQFIRTRGFTLIELLVVIAIIGVISGILVIGLGKVGASRKRDQTATMLSSLNSAMTGLTQSPAASFKLFAIQLPAIYFPADIANGKTFQDDSQYNSWIGVPASSLEAQVRTSEVLKIINSDPNGKAILDAFPADRRAKFTTTIGGVDYPAAANAAAQIPVPLDAWGNPVIFVFDNLLIPTGTNVGRPFTVTVSGTSYEVGGVTNVYSDSDKSYYEPEKPLAPKAPTYAGSTGTGKSTMPQPPETYTRPTDYNPRRGPTLVGGVHPIETTFRSPDHRPFWMSAGPDGKYETIDDNVFSFGN